MRANSCKTEVIWTDPSISSYVLYLAQGDGQLLQYMTYNFRYIFSLSILLLRRAMTTKRTDYETWTREQLIERLVALEDSKSATLLHSSSSLTNAPTTTTTANVVHVDALPDLPARIPPKPKTFNFAQHHKRKIALKFCYSGWEYGGLAYQTTHASQTPAVENVLFDAMAKARLVDPSRGLEGCEWEKCGRTDKGVSAAGQVISLWIRSALGEVEVKKKVEDVFEDSELPGTLVLSRPPSSPPVLAKQRPELDYVGVLNRLLPPTIRVLAWSPVAPTFSARFSCQYRHYKYFFSSHSLDISAMREAAADLVGEHDFRNLCKIDAQKQITKFRRTISRADIEPIDLPIGGERGEMMYVFNLIGNAFLYHQVRNIVSILFLIGTGLEKPSLVTKLMNVAPRTEPTMEDEELEAVESKPEYQMADALPLMLWDCGYAEEDVRWRSQSVIDVPSSSMDRDTRRSGQGTETDLYHQLHSKWNRSRVYTMLDRHFLQAAEQYHRPPRSDLPLSSTSAMALSDSDSIAQNLGAVAYPLGGGAYRRAAKYTPVLRRNRLDTVDVINERWRLGKGSRKAERKEESGVCRCDLDDGNE